jgi:hypothetical protein
MSYLTLPSGISNFSRAVISFWFRVPQRSLDAAAAAFTDNYTGPPPLFNGIMPLAVMAKEGSFQPFATTQTEVPDPEGGHTGIFTQVTTPSGNPLPTNPVCIGLDCSVMAPPNTGTAPYLYANFETSQKAVASSYEWDMRTFDPSTYVDVSAIVLDNTAAISGTNIYLALSGSGADQWHHVLISINLQTTQTHGTAYGESYTGRLADYVDSGSQLFIALDDVNYTGFDLSNQFPNGSSDLNMVIPVEAIDVAGTPQTTDPYNSYPTIVPIGGVPQYLLSNPLVMTSGQPLGFPAAAAYVDHILNVELAEFQMWTGVTFNTGIEANRRAFIDYRRDSKGVPILDKNGKLTLVPVDPAKAANLIGRKPNVELHKSGNWIKGNNTGSTGVGTDGKPISAGQFKPTGVIKKYKPDPSIVVT